MILRQARSSSILVALATLLMASPALAASLQLSRPDLQGEPEPSGRPNILLCLADDQSYPHASAYGEPVILTPVFDRIAREGVLFHHALLGS